MLRALLTHTAARVQPRLPPVIADWLAGNHTVRPMAAYLAAHDEWRRADEILAVLHPIGPGDDACELAMRENFFRAVMAAIEAQTAKVADLSSVFVDVLEHCATALMWRDALGDAALDCPTAFKKHAQRLLDTYTWEAANE